MPKIITSRYRESEVERARQYIKVRLMLPTIPMAMVTLLTGYGGLAMMWFEDRLTASALISGTLLFVTGAVLGWAHVQYERYLVRTAPEYLARKQKLLDAAQQYRRPKTDLTSGGLQHKGRRLVVLAYVLGIGGMLALSVSVVDRLGIYAAFFLPWAGYFNAKVIFWRSLFAR
jgi:small-conductance mechanosensitive channel